MAATKEEAVNTDSNARFGGEVEWNVSGAPIALSWYSRSSRLTPTSASNGGNTGSKPVGDAS